MMFGDDKKKEKKKKEKKKNRFSKKTLLVILLVIGLLSGTAYIGYYYFFVDKPGEIEKSGLPEEILEFAFEFMPQVHAGVRAISDEIVLTENEIIRLEEIEKNFPDQGKITKAEKKVWDKNFSSLTKFLEKHEKEIQTLYVSYRVNQETGQILIDEKKEALSTASGNIVESSKILTDKIRALEEAKSLLDKAKESIGLK